MGGDLAQLLSDGSPEAFVVAAALDDTDRAALIDDIRRWLGGVKQASRVPLLAWIDEAAWPDVVAFANTAAQDGADLVRKRAEHILDEAARQVPHLTGETRPRQPALHLAFETGFLEQRWPHPTQVAPPPDAPRLRFGGTSADGCGFCGQPLHHLLTHAGFELATCLSCLGWEQPLGDYALWYRHDPDGTPHPLDRLPNPVTPRFPSAPLAGTSIALVDLGPRFWTQSWGSAGRGANLHRYGGEPAWVQDDEVRPCRACGVPMVVVLQLDSELPQTDGRTFAFGSGGLLFVQVCETCRISTLLWQCT